MIHYPISRAELESRIAALSPRWLSRAKLRTRKHRSAGRFEGQGIWSDIKSVYMALQQFKCAYCERALEMGWSASVEHDVEHFRPKGAVLAWPPPEIRKRRRIRYRVRNGASGGYPLLAHSHLNYLVACAVCNSPHKRSYFPISGAADSTTEDLPALNRREKPLLVFPIGEWGDDPRELLTFRGCVVIPAKTSGVGHRRAQVCIDLFELDTRGRLLTERAHLLMLLWELLERRRTGMRRKRASAQASLDALTAARAPHAACAHAFVQLYERNRSEARRHHQAACELAQGKEPKLYERYLARR